ncbi:sulfotransferase family 2 domain-containing protein [Roseobacter sp.]|uniref:sulfotransferase family 2 domain-containing protein n=1 Tax=Roseobacter sp. TaxID=1907202 RepID=UPI0032997D22
MIISAGRAYIFVHIPKTGGTSLATALEARAMRDDILIGDTPKARRRKARLAGAVTHGRLWKHATLADIDGLIAPEQIARCFTFTVVRNPWDRVVSTYHWLRDQSFDHAAVDIAKSQDFAGFLQTPHIQDMLHATPARSYMTDITGKERCDLYVRLERFDHEVAPLVAYLGFPLTMPHLNKSVRPRDYRGLYDATTRDLVGRFCAEDIARFDYKFDLPR